MALIDHIALRRAPDNCAQNSLIQLLLTRAKRCWRQRNQPGIGKLNSHLARDVGLDAADLARHQHQWPSQTHVHPRL